MVVSYKGIQGLPLTPNMGPESESVPKNENAEDGSDSEGSRFNPFLKPDFRCQCCYKGCMRGWHAAVARPHMFEVKVTPDSVSQRFNGLNDQTSRNRDN